MTKKKYHFPGQRSNEKIVVFTRRHWVFMLSSFLFAFLIIASYLVALFILIAVTPLDFSGPSKYVITTVTGIVLLMFWLFLFIRWIDYYLDIWILTNERIVQIKQLSLFNRQTAGFDLATVQDVASRQKGVFSTFLNYGTIFVQTAATTELFEFKYIPKPFQIKRQVLDAQDQLEYAAKRELGAIVTRGKVGKSKPPGGRGSEVGKQADEVQGNGRPITRDQERIIKRGFPGIQ